MSILTIPSGLLVRSQKMGQLRQDLEFAAGDSGIGQTRILAPERWTMSLISPQWMTAAEAAIWRDLILRLRGRVHQLAAYDMDNTAPAGTMRGTLTLASAVAVGATTISVTGGAGQAGTTMLAGDWVGIGSGSTRQLLSVAANATANGSGVISLTVSQPARWAQLIASSVVWDKPTALFKQRNAESDWSRDGDIRTGYSLDLVEAWES